MAKLTTRNALFVLLFEEKYELVFFNAGYTRADRHRYRRRYKRSELTLDLMEEILEKCGFTVAVEKQWNKPFKL